MATDESDDFVIRGKSQYPPAPEGLHHAVCVDIVDRGIVETKFGPKPQWRLVWELETTRDDGKRHLISQTFSPSLHERSNLRKLLKQWRGRDFTAEELDLFKLKSVLHVPCQIVLVHAESEGNIYANIASILKADPQHRILPSGQYVRIKDRPENQQAQHVASAVNDEQNLPF